MNAECLSSNLTVQVPRLVIDNDAGTVTIRYKRVCLFDYIRAISYRGQTCKMILFKYFACLLLYAYKLTFSARRFTIVMTTNGFAILKSTHQ